MARVCVYSSFDTLPAGYAALFEAAGQQRSFFLSLPWFSHLSQSGVGSRIQPHIYGLEADSPDLPVQAALPMWHDPSTASWFGSRKLVAAANYYSALFAPLLTGHDSSTAQQQLSALVAAIGQAKPGWDTIDLHPLEQTAPSFALLLRAFADANMPAFSYFCAGNWFLDVGKRSYAEVFAALPSRLKNTIKRKSGQLNRAARLELVIASTPDEVSRLIGGYRQIYQQSWKQPEPFPDFIPGWLMESAQQGWLRMGMASIDAQPAAMQIWLVHQNKASIYKLAYDEQYASHSIGSILTAHLLAHVIDIDGVGEVDFLNGDEPYKQDWMSQRREYWGIVACNKNTWKGRLAALALQSAKYFRQWKRLKPKDV